MFFGIKFKLFAVKLILIILFKCLFIGKFNKIFSNSFVVK